MSDVTNNRVYVDAGNTATAVIPIPTPQHTIGVTDTTLGPQTLVVDPITWTANISAVIARAASKANFIAHNVHICDVTSGAIVMGSQSSATTAVTLTTMAEKTNWSLLKYLATGRYVHDSMVIFFSDSGMTQASQRFMIELYVQQAPSPYGQTWNMGLSYAGTSNISPSLFYHSYNGVSDASLSVSLNVASMPDGLTVSPSSFTMQDVLDSKVSISLDATKANNLYMSAGCNIVYTLTHTPTNTIVVQNATFRTGTYYHNSYPSVRSATDSTSAIERMTMPRVVCVAPVCEILIM
jgi:hypothetical protein